VTDFAVDRRVVTTTAAWCLVAWLGVALTGCGAPNIFTGPGGDLTITSRVNPDLKVKAAFDEGFYALDDRNQITVVLIDGDVDNPTAAMTVRMLWRPMYARTPIEATATNATVHVVVFREPGPLDAPTPTALPADGDNPSAGARPADAANIQGMEDADIAPPVIDPNNGQVAIYSGAGFLYPYARPGRKKLEVGMWEASVRLRDASAGYDDEWGPAEVKGRFTVRRDDQQIHRLLHTLRVKIRERLGYPRLVRER